MPDTIQRGTAHDHLGLFKVRRRFSGAFFFPSYSAIATFVVVVAAQGRCRQRPTRQHGPCEIFICHFHAVDVNLIQSRALPGHDGAEREGKVKDNHGEDSNHTLYISDYITETELLGAGLLTGFFWRRVERLAFLQFFFS